MVDRFNVEGLDAHRRTDPGVLKLMVGAYRPLCPWGRDGHLGS